MGLRLPDSWSNWNLETLVFEERGKPEYAEKNLSEQRREPTTNLTHTWRRRRDLNPGHIGGRRALSPLRHPCSETKLCDRPKVLRSCIQCFSHWWNLLHVQVIMYTWPKIADVAPALRQRRSYTTQYYRNKNMAIVFEAKIIFEPRKVYHLPA